MSNSPSAVLVVGEGRTQRPRFTGAGLRLSDHKLILGCGDLIISIVSSALSLWLWALIAGEPLRVLIPHPLWVAAGAAWLLLLLPTYHVSAIFAPKVTARLITQSAAVALFLYLALYFMAPRELLPRLVILNFLVLAAGFTLAWHVAYIHLLTRPESRSRVVIVGTGPAGQMISDVMRQRARHLTVVAFVADKPQAVPEAYDIAVATGPDGLTELVARSGASEIVLATDGQTDSSLLRALVKCQESGVEVVRMSTIYERLLQRIPVGNIEPDWVFTSLVDAMRLQDASRVAKRAIDIVGALAGTVVLLLLLPIAVPAIWLSDGRPIFFRQQRVGRNNKPFQLIKFRSMIEDAERDGPQWAGVRDRRVTRLGSFLRRSRLDELPQFLNVLKGDMSLVGPRPERPEFVAELEQVIPFYRTRLLVRPGLTGWAQVNYRYGDSVGDAALKLEYDLYYIKHRSMLFDFWIALRTVKTLVMFSGR